jgi:plasmid stabilization system protein ParE
MTLYRLTPQAINDIFNIWSYIAQESSAAADRVEEAIYLACELLARSPMAGTVRVDLTPLPVRFWVVPPHPNYFVVYDPEAKPIEIIRVLHAARNIGSLLR